MALAPSNPGWFTGYVPSAAEWAAEWSSKVDFPAPIWQGGTGGVTAPAANYNILQRTLIDASMVTPLQLITQYGVKTSAGHATLLLLPLAQTTPGDWISLADVDGSAGTNPITIQANGSETIDLYGTVTNTQQIGVDWGEAVLVSTGTKWVMLAVTSPAPAVTGGVLNGTETWNVMVGGTVKSINVADIADYIGVFTKYLQWAVWFNYTPGADELLALYTAASVLTFPPGLIGSQGSPPIVNPTADFVLNINKIVGGVSSVVGTITIDTAGAVTFASAGFSANIGDQLSVTGPTPADASIAGFSATLKAIITS